MLWISNFFVSPLHQTDESDAAKKAKILSLVPGYMNRAEELKQMIAVPAFDAAALAALPSSNSVALSAAVEAIAVAHSADRAGNAKVAKEGYERALGQARTISDDI